MTKKQIINIHQIFISSLPISENSISKSSRSNMVSFMEIYKEANYFLWDNEKIIALIKKYFSDAVMDSYRKLHAYTAKADLARYCILYVYGGIYSDLSNKFFRRISIKENDKFVFFRDSEPYGTACWAATSTILFSEPRQIELKIAIEMIVHNTNNKYYGMNSLCPTGPIMLGRVLAFSNRELSYACGTMIPVSAKYKNRNHVFIDEEGNLIALRTQGVGGNPKSIGLNGTNNYNKIWNGRYYYGEIIPYQMRYFNIFFNNFAQFKKLFHMLKKSPMPRSSIKESNFSIVIGENTNNNARSRDIYIFDESKLCNIIHNNFPPEVFNLFIKADSHELKKYIGCLCVLAVYGGTFINNNVELIGEFNTPHGKHLSVFRDISPVKSKPWSINLGIIKSSPRSREIYLSIHLLVIYLKTSNNRGVAAYHLISDIVGRAMSLIGCQEKYWCGETQQISDAKFSTRALISPTGTMIAQQGCQVE